ncbi:MAG: ubiquinol-cytochrome C chaperone family protein [Litorimonas sp.]
MGLFDKLMGRELPERRDARKIYFRLLEQARTPGLFGNGRFADDFDGRIDSIALHMAVLMERLQSEGEDGRLLNQALFDEMKDDFEIALREQAIGDTGVKKRMKPIIGHFYDRLKAYTDGLKAEDPASEVSGAVRTEDGENASFADRMGRYATAFLGALKDTSMKDLTAGRFYFPDVDAV